MFKQQNQQQQPPTNHHFSTSSSVYSPIDSEYTFKNNNHDIIEEVDDEDIDSDLNYHPEQQQQHSNNNSINRLSNESKGMRTEESNQTFQTFMTARGLEFSEDENGSGEFHQPQKNPSFESINRSLLKQPSLNSLDSYTKNEFSDDPGSNQTNTSYYDDDKTPKIPTSAQYNNKTIDSLDDKTPLLSNNDPAFDPLLPQQQQQSIPRQASPNPNELTTQLPQQELSSKFQRLSVTLQQTTTSGDSYQFMNTFQQNVNRLSKDQFSKPGVAPTSRYYNKIEEFRSQKDNSTDYDEPSDNDSYIKDDQESQLSSISNRSSIISQSSNIEPEHNNPQATPIISNVSSSSSNAFNFNSTNNNNGDQPKSTSNSSSAYNIRGSRVSPIKTLRNGGNQTSNDDEIPVRRDLVNQFEKLASNNEEIKKMSEKEKNDLLIASKNGLNISDRYPHGLNISITDSLLDPKNRDSQDDDDDDNYEISQSAKSQQHLTASNTSKTIATTNSALLSGNEDDDNDDDLSSLFIRALHSFDSSTLQSESDASICLSFDKDDLAFVHTIDDSGWGEVTLVNSLQRGWIPMNYFEIAVDEKADSTINDIDDDGKIPNNKYLKPLFHSCAKFLMNPLSHKNRRGKYTFSIRTINSIRDGVRLLLQQTDCLSRSNEIVTKRPVVRKTRKSLLADWYNLMVKANEFKGTSNFNKIEILTLMIFQVTKKAVSFLKIWSIESKEILQQKQDSQKPGQIKESKSSNEDLNNYPLLASPPLAKQRITEINGILYSYLGLIIGRLDLIEHNPIGCDLLETIAHQIILLLRELLFISKTGSDFSSEKPADLDNSLDSLLSLVSDLVSSVKNLVVKTLNESESEKKSNVLPSMGNNADKYYYTQEGGNLIQIASKMIKSIGLTISSIRKLLDITGDFKLNSARSYPDYTKMKIDPEDFIKKCSIGIAKHNKRPDDDDEAAFRRPQTSAAVKNSNRYSMIRSGKTGELSLTSNGANLIHDVLLAGSNDANSPFSVSIPAFEPYTTATAANKSESNSNLSDINNELLVDSNGNLLGASFHGLVYTLTNEDSPPEYFFVSTFFICFRTFANGIDFIEEMISRFDITHNISSNLQGQTRADITAEVQLKKRRRLIVKMFQIWMESYWNHEADYSLLTTLINFFNEGISHFLPIEATKLIEIAAKLSTKPLIENQIQLRNLPRANGYNPQLISRSITITRFKRKNSFSSNTDNSLSNRYSMVDGYELSKINTNSSTTSSLKSISLPMPLGIGNQTSSSNSLLTKNQFQTIEKVNMTYRQILSTSWCPQKYIETSHYINLDISNLLGNWFQVCDQTWVLSNYRPNLLDFNGLELAKQLTSIESNIFCSIKPEELLNENFTAKRAYLRLAPNVRQSLLFTNCLSGYVLESILQPKINQKLRINMIKTWLKVAISCLYLRNFNSLAAIITALQSHLITRLNKIWGDLSDKYIELYEYLSSIIHPEKNYHVYRSKLKNFLISNDYNIPIVPYFSLFLQDLTFVTDGNPNYRKANTFLNQKLINIDKYLKITRIIADIESLQIPYTNSSTTTTSSKELRRSSISFNAKIPNSSTSTNLEMEDYTIVSVPSLQELILLELWKVCQLNKAEEDRAWKLSCTIQPRDVSSSSS